LYFDWQGAGCEFLFFTGFWRYSLLAVVKKVTMYAGWNEVICCKYMYYSHLQDFAAFVFVS